MQKVCRIIKAAVKLTLAAAAACVLFAYAKGMGIDEIKQILIETALPQNTVSAANNGIETSDSGDFIFIESANVLAAAEDRAEQAAMVTADETQPPPKRDKIELSEDYEPLMTNQTDYAIDAAALLESDIIRLDPGDEPQILIVHTHSSESYSPDENYNFTASDGGRTLDTNYNVVRVGDRLTELLEDGGISVLHYRDINDYPSYNGSYSRMLKVIKQYLSDYPSIKAVLDVHRDAIFYNDGTACPLTAEIEGEKSAQLMYVVGTNEGGLTHDGWKKNLAFAMQLQKCADAEYPGLMRGINIRSERFNQHMTAGSLILEVGSSGNSLTEALRGIEYFAKILLEVLSGV